MKIIEKILVLIIILLLIFPAVQKEYPVVKIRELDGDFILAEKPEFDMAGWYSGKFQAEFDKYLEDHIGFRDFLVRLTNQIDYDLFRKPHAEGVTIGKHDQFFEYDYIRAYTGEDFIGEKIIDQKIRRLKFLQEYLKQEKNIDLVLVFDPGKASIFSEYIPDKYLKKKIENTNYDCFVRKADEYKVRYIDFNKYFKLLKGNTKYPLYPKYGIHWSIYGMSFAADSLINYIEQLRQIDMPDVYIDSLEIEKHARRPDYDVGKTLNLLWRLPEDIPLAYPVYSFENNPEKERPMVLAVADSYYWNIYNTRIPRHLFKNEAYWYFYSKVYPETYFKPLSVSELNLQEEIEKQDVIFLMVTERFLFKFDWGFIDDAYVLYAPYSEFENILKIRNGICSYNVWFNSIIEKANRRNISVGEMLDLEAEYAYSQENLDKLLTFKGQEYFEKEIKRNKILLKSVKAKAEGKNISLEKMIPVYADYLFKTEHPEIYEKYKVFEKQKQLILNDSLLTEEIKISAQKYYLTFDEMLQIEAEKIIE